MIRIHPVKQESYLLWEKQCWPAEGGFPKPIALCIPRLCPRFHSKYFTSGYQRRNKGGTKINRYFYFIHILSKSGYATIIIIYKSSRWTVFFFQVSLAETRTGSFSEESRCSGARNKFIILPVSLRLQQNILNISTSLRKIHLRTPFFPRTAPSGCFRRKQPIEVFCGKKLSWR